jgi:hypothetical protein
MTTVREPLAHTQLVQWYEGLRAQATGQVPATTPRGLSLLLHSGLPAWMAACPPVTPDPTPARAVSSASATPVRPLTHMSAELVGVLTEMALGGLRRCRL